MFYSDYYTYRVNRLVKRFDRSLLARRSPDGVIRVIQKTRDGESFVFALTEAFRADARPVEWGIEALWDKMQSITLENRDKFFETMRREREQYEEKRKRERRNTFEDMASELRPVLSKTMGNILTHSMDKSKDPRRRYDERMKKWL